MRKFILFLSLCFFLQGLSAENFSFAVFDGSNRKLKVKDCYLYDTGSIRILVTPESFRAMDYRYRYMKGKYSKERLAAQPKRPFFLDLFLYRIKEDQWMQLEVTAKDGTKKSITVGLKGGNLTAPPDKPLTGIEYARGMMNGRITQGVEGWVNKTSEEELEEKDVLRWKRLGFKSIRINMAPSYEFLKSVNPKYGKDWNQLLEKYVDILLRHGQYIFFSRFGHWAKESRYKVKGDTETPEQLDVAMKTILDDETKWWTTLVKFWRFKSHKLAYEFFVEAKKKTFPCYTNQLNHYYERMTPKIRAIDPTRVLIFTAPRHNFIYIDRLNIPKSAGPYAMSQAHKGFLGSSPKLQALKERLKILDFGTKWANKHGVPVILGAATSWAGEGEYTPELCKYLSALCRKLNNNKVPCPISWWANDTPMVAAAEQNFRFAIDMNDYDHDGLSDIDEKKYGTDMKNIDTDGDNITDKAEIDLGLNPKDVYDGFVRGNSAINGDLDGDGIGNAYEFKRYIQLKKEKKPLTSFNPKVADSNLDFDGDGVSNLWEILLNLKPDAKFSQAHSAGSYRRIKKLSAAEKAKVTDANRDDDGDGMSNIDEIKAGRWPMDKKDTDRDGLKEDDPIPYISDKGHIVMLVFEDDILNYAPEGIHPLKISKSGDLAIVPGAPRGKALSVKSQNAYLALPKFDKLNPDDLKERLVAVRFKIRSTKGKQVLFVQGDKKSGLALYLLDGALYGGIWNGKEKRFAKIGKVIAGKWYHTALNIDIARKELRGFLNGLKTVTAHLPAKLQHWGIPYGKNNTIGNSALEIPVHSGVITKGSFLDGEIDELNIYNRMLSEVDISRLAMSDLPLPVSKKH